MSAGRWINQSWNSLNEAIWSVYGEEISITGRIPVAGGDINRAYTLALSDGRSVFMKMNQKMNAGFFQSEAEGLTAIRETKTIRTPEVIAVGTDEKEAFLLLEFIETGPRGKKSSEELGLALAQMHRSDTGRFVKSGRFGFTSDNYIGANIQINAPEETWIDFFIQRRLLPQFEKALPYFNQDERKKIDFFLNQIDRFLVEPEKPSLLHGDLWSGNYMIDREGHPWLIDPAVYVGHAEADLAMTELFGGFDSVFYDTYRNAAGIDPDYQDRKDLYNLYHLLNHLNLFGRGYLNAIRSVMNRYV